MSSSPGLDYPTSDDVNMGDETNNPQNSPSPTKKNPLFLAGTPSTSGTPSQRRFATPQSTPLRNVLSGREQVTPRVKGTPLFNPSLSSPMAIPTSTPSKQPKGRTLEDSDALTYPTTPRDIKTPKNRRGDIHSSMAITPSSTGRRVRRHDATTGRSDAPTSDGMHLDVPPSSQNLSAKGDIAEEPDEIRAIWGTTVNLSETMKLFAGFLTGFKPKYRIAYDRDHGISTRILADPEEGEALLYESYLRRMRITGETNLNLDAVNLLAYPPSKKLYTQLIKYPQEVIPAMDQVLKDVMLEIAELDLSAVGGDGEDLSVEIGEIMGRVYKIRPYGLPAINMRDLNPSDTDKLTCIKGLVIRATPVIPDMKVAFFRCLTCSHSDQVDIDRGKIEEPVRCPREVCGSVGTMSLIHNRCEYADRQVIRLQETPDAVPDGQTPHTVSLSVYDELVDVTKPGDRVIITGIFRSVPIRVNPRQRTMKSLFKTYLDVVHIKLGTVDGMGFDRSTRPLGGDRNPGVGGAGDGTYDGDGQQADKTELENKLRELSTRPDIYDVLARSLAPSIWEMDDVKKGILLQLFGGTNKSIARGGGGGGPRYRGDINVLLVGDPGTAKSQILHYVHKLAPRGIYTSGKGSSAAGLTAYVTRDPESKQLVLESGALVLSDGGVCCIDEFDKMSDATRSVLHEVMEQQTVSVAKAGIITTLNARTSILAAANPVGSKYDVNMPITQNIDLPPTLISRFDLLYLVLDQVDEGLDRRLAQHLVGLYLEDAPAAAVVNETILTTKELTAYIDYARNRIHPVITEDAGNELVNCYVEMRDMGDDPSGEKRITATTRQLESMIRLSEGHARMRFSEFVELEDVKEAYRLMREAIRTSAVDPRTGKIDIGLLNTGTGQGQRRLREDMRRELMTILSKPENSKGVRWGELMKRLGEQSSIQVNAADFGEVVKLLENEGSVKILGERDKRTIRKIEM